MGTREEKGRKGNIFRYPAPHSGIVHRLLPWQEKGKNMVAPKKRLSV